MSRVESLPTDKMTPEQREVHDAIATGPRGGVRGPFPVLLHVPELAARVAHLGEQLRFGTSFPDRLMEIAVLVTARHVRCRYEWRAHARTGEAAGVSPAVIEAIRTGSAPPFDDEGERVVHDFARELLELHAVSDATYRAAQERFGAVGTVELSALVGYFTMVANVLNAHGVGVDDGDPFAD